MAARISERAALRELAAQHAALRDRIARCHALADELDAGRLDAAVLLDAVSELRLAFDVHNQFEERLLRSRVLVPGGPGAMRVARTAEDHAGDHQAMRRGLASTTSAQLREVLASLCAHLDAEDRGLVARGIRRAAPSR